MFLFFSLQDRGEFDGIQRILYGSSLKFWLHRLLFLDSLSYLSHGQISLNLERLILIDIDDIFVGEKGTRLRPDDVVVRRLLFNTIFYILPLMCSALIGRMDILIGFARDTRTNTEISSGI